MGQFKLANTIAGAFVLVYTVFGLVHLFDPAQRDFHDFNLYYHTALEFTRGGNPYDFFLQYGQYKLHYIYPTLTLYLFVPFTWLPYDAACLSYLVLKLCALVMLIVVWSRCFLHRAGVWLWLFCLLAFNNAIYIDLQIGNVEIFLQLLIWSGLGFYLAGRYRAFSAMILAAGFFKITPIVLLGLIIFKPGMKKAWAALLWPLIGFIALFAVSILLEPDWWMRLQIEIGRNASGPAPYNQSFLNLVRDIMTPLWGSGGNGGWATLVFLAYALLIAGVTAHVLRVDSRKNSKEVDPIVPVMFGVLAYLLILPRLADFQMAIAMVPCFFLIQHAKLPTAPLLFVLVVVQAVNIRLPALAGVYRLFFNYKLFIIISAAWVVYALAIANPQRYLRVPGEPLPEKP